MVIELETRDEKTAPVEARTKVLDGLPTLPILKPLELRNTETITFIMNENPSTGTRL